MQHDERSVVLGHVWVLQAGGKAKCFDAHFAGRFQWRGDRADFVDPYAASASCQSPIAAAKKTNGVKPSNSDVANSAGFNDI